MLEFWEEELDKEEDVGSESTEDEEGWETGLNSLLSGLLGLFTLILVGSDLEESWTILDVPSELIGYNKLRSID